MSILGNPVCLPIGGKAAKGSHLFLGVSLPRSIYYEQAADWLKIKDNSKPLVNELNWDGQVVCGNTLWEFCNNHAYAYSLENGDLLEDVTLSGIAGQCCQGITTDGESRIWILRIDTPGDHSSDVVYQRMQYHLYEFDTGTKSIKSLYQSPQILVMSCSHTSAGRVSQYEGCQVQQCRSAMMGYSKITQSIYFGGLGISGQSTYEYYSNTSYHTVRFTVYHYDTSLFVYDLSSNQMILTTNRPTSQQHSTGAFFFDDGDDFYTGGGYAHHDYTSNRPLNLKEKSIYKYTKSTNTWTNVTNAFEGYTVGYFSYVQIGDKMLQISKDATGVFDPKTGNLEQSTVPTVPPDSMVMYPGFKAYANNILYLVTNQGIYKCPFFSEVPEDAPIVAKIYKGQKYHTLEPFEIPNKIKFLRTQQVADKDYEIKMYEYASEGGQTIFIEDVGE